MPALGNLDLSQVEWGDAGYGLPGIPFGAHPTNSKLETPALVLTLVY